MLKIVLSTLLLTSCSALQFKSDQSLPITLDSRPGHKKEVVISGTSHFMWWGLNPQQHVIVIDEELKKAGVQSLSQAIIFEERRPSDVLVSFLTLGIYMPRAWSIIGLTGSDVTPKGLSPARGRQEELSQPPISTIHSAPVRRSPESSSTFSSKIKNMIEEAPRATDDVVVD